VGLLPENARRKSLGITVIEALTEQLEGHYSLINDNGTTFELTFRLDS
jgi:two-component sensor histidine kinase